MWKFIKGTLVCLCLGLVFSGNALAEKAQSAPRQKVAVYVFDTTSESFADLLSPGISLGQEVSSLFRNKNKNENVVWTLNSFFLFLPYVHQGLQEVLALNGTLTATGWTISPITTNFVSFSYYQPAFLLAFYQEQIGVNVVPEASAGAMMALGLPLLGWFAWRRRGQS